MRALKERADALEAYYVHEQENAFKARARGAKVFGLWAAGQMGLKEEASARYAAGLACVGALSRNADPVFDRVRQDFHASGLPFSETWLKRQLDSTVDAALQEVEREG